MQLLWKIVWRVLKKLKIALPYDLAIPLLGICSKELNAGSQSDFCTSMSQHYHSQESVSRKQPKCEQMPERYKENVV